MPVNVFVLYSPPADPAAFDAHYRDVHIPLAKAMPHLTAFEVSDGLVDVQGGDPIHLVVRLEYETREDLETSLSSPEGQAAVADLANFAQAGVVLVTAGMRGV